MPYAFFENENGSSQVLLYDAPNPAPNPRRVRIYCAEKGINVQKRALDLRKGEHKSDEFVALNPLGQVPALELDDGTVIAESIAICRFFETLHPDPPLFGTGPRGVALVEMWLRRVELQLVRPLSNVWLHTHPYTAKLVVPQYREFGESNRPHISRAFRLFDQALADQSWLGGESYSIADITLLTSIDFAKLLEIEIGDDCPRLQDWYARASARKSASA